MKKKLNLLLALFILFVAGCTSNKKSNSGIDNSDKKEHKSSNPAQIILNPKNQKYKDKNSQWQGIPSIEITKEGTLLAVFYSGGTTEGIYNYVLVVKNEDKSKTWSDIRMAIERTGTKLGGIFNYRFYDSAQEQKEVFYF